MQTSTRASWDAWCVVRAVGAGRQIGREAAGQVEQKAACIGHDAARRGDVIEEPTATIGVEIVLAHPAARFGRMNDARASDVDRDVIDAAVILEHHEVARRQRIQIRTYAVADARLIA